MLSFWAELDVSAIESYARGLLLPDDMSHLTLERFDFTRQPHNRDGRTALLLHYVGVGRVEEFSLPPEQHVRGMLERLPERIDPEKISFSEKDALWNWNAASPSKAVLRVFFRPASQRPVSVAKEPYPSDQAYVSVSRREIFFAQNVLRDYILVRCRETLRPDSPLFDPETAERLTTETHAGTVHFRLGTLAGSFLPGDEKSSRDLIRFARLEEPLTQLTDYVTRDFQKGRALLDEEAFRLPLFPPEENT